MKEFLFEIDFELRFPRNEKHLETRVFTVNARTRFEAYLCLVARLGTEHTKQTPNLDNLISISEIR